MKNMLTFINSICDKHLLKEKIVIMPSHAAGNQLLQAYLAEGYAALNLKTTTLTSLAEKTSKIYLHHQGLSLIPDSVAKHLMIEILQEISQGDKLTYFDKLEITPGISRTIYNALIDLKMSGFTPKSIAEHKFVSIDKGADLRQIFSTYEEALKKHNYIDIADLFTLAAKKLPLSGEKPVYIIAANLDLSPVEKQFLELLTTNDYHVLKPAEPWLYDMENASDDVSDETIDMFQAYGESNEVREVIRRIKKSNVPFDKVAVYYTTQEPYSQSFYELAQKLELPVTFGEGIKIQNTRPGRLFANLLNWLKNDYNAADLISLITSGDFKIYNEELPGNRSIARLLKRAKIGWGRNRYIPQLNREIDASLDSSEEIKQNLLKLREFMEGLLKLFPQADSEEKVPYGAYVKGIVKFIDSFSQVSSQIDGEAKSTITEELSQIGEMAEGSLSLEEVLTRVSGVVEGMRVNSSSPKPGHLHLTHYTKGLWVYRPYNFVVGLDGQRFPGQLREDAILLDVEREALGNNLALKRHKNKENTDQMAELLSSVPGTLTLSYSAFDTVESKEVFPSSLLLQAYRFVTGDKNKDYSQLIGFFGNKQKGFVPREETDCLDEADWWLNKIYLDVNLINKDKTVLDCYHGIRQGLTALRERMKNELTPYDGKVDLESEALDPRINHKRVMSASRLEKLATCPYSYFLSYVLKIKPVEELVFDSNQWLDPATRGSLLHGIFEQFYRTLKGKGEKPKVSEHKSVLIQIAEMHLAEQKNMLPPPSNIIYEYEAREIIESCRIFLSCEEEISQDVSPQYFELAFGFKDATDNSGLGELSPVEIALSSDQKFFLNGKVDRVDVAVNGKFKVVDYKTGSTYSYEERKYYRGGRQMQHTLYAIAVEEIFKHKSVSSNPQVSEGGYFFPTLKGEGVRIMRSQSKREDLYEIISHALDILTVGEFPMTDNKEDCTFCDYVEICRRELLESTIKEKIASGTCLGIEKLRRVRDYE